MRTPEKIYTVEHLQDDLALGFFGSKYISARASWILVLWLIGGTIAHLLHLTDAPAVRAIVGFPIAVLGAYLLAGFACAIVLFVARPLRGFFIGWLVTGYVAGAALYGSVGLVMTLAYVWFGVNMGNFKSPEEAWNLLPSAMTYLGFVGLAAGGIFYAQDKWR